MSAHDEPRLPPELEREIFETTALMYPSTIPPLLRVARRVLIWIEPLLYRTLNVGEDSPHFQQFHAASSKPPAFLAQAVRCVVLHTGYDYDTVSGTLSLCTGCTRLAVDGGESARELLPILSTWPIQRLAGFLCSTLDLMNVPEDISAYPLLRCLTHLDLFDSIRSHEVLPIVDALPSLPFLTHLAISHSGPLDTVRELLERILKDCRHLHILAVPNYDMAHGAKEDFDAHKTKMGDVPESLRDPRLVLCSYELWFEGVSDGPNFWKAAEDLVARKRRREVDANVFWAP
ncbi:hypothetical protein C8F01DRAFT_1166830 [Mycena amicta]|nr:hypothetical protein C8F01DRAFT_1172899 [Mycena amicta]KAJ7053601.1 hypothetical protein C8F01DRAFT_1166830 [Mycena amicta]